MNLGSMVPTYGGRSDPSEKLRAELEDLRKEKLELEKAQLAQVKAADEKRIADAQKAKDDAIEKRLQEQSKKLEMVMKENLRANDREQYLKRKLQETNEFNAKESVLCTSLRGIFFIGEVCVPELREPSQQLYLQRCQPLVAPYLPGPLPLLV